MALEWLHDRTEDVDGTALARGISALLEHKRLEDATRDAERLVYHGDNVPYGFYFENAARAITFDEGRAKLEKFVDDAPNELLWKMVERVLKAKIVRAILKVERDPAALAAQYAGDGRFSTDAPRFNFVLAAVCTRLSVAFSNEEAEVTARAVSLLTMSECTIDRALDVAASLLDNLNSGFGLRKARDAVFIGRSSEGVTLRFNKSQYIP